MPENNMMIEQPKMNIFQKFRKNRLMKKLDWDNYKKAPMYLKQDVEVIDALLEASPDSINVLRPDLKESAIQRNNTLINNLSQYEQKEVLDKNPEFVYRDGTTLEHENMVWLDLNDLDYLDWLPADILVVNELKKRNKF